MSHQRIQLGVVGACGRVGRRIVALVQESDVFDVVAALEFAGHGQLGQDIGTIAGVGELGVAVSDSLSFKPDVVIDFSLPASTMRWVAHFRQNGIAVVIGTTGLSAEQQGELAKAGGDIPVLFAPNMSLGMNLLFGLVGQVAKALGSDYDIEIAETHHRFKRDAPSGTALELAKRIAKEIDWPFPDCLEHGRNGKEALRKGNSIGMHALRAGDTVGIHSVYYSTLGETIEIKHTAHSRDTFVRGALRGAQWLVHQKPGLYSMADVLGL